MRDNVITPPSDEPVSLPLVKSHIRLLHSDLDTVVSTYMQIAVELVESKTGMQLMEATREVITDKTTDEIFLFREPFIEVVSVKKDNEDIEYDLYDNEKPVRIEIATTKAPVHVRYKAGYTSAANIPTDLKGAILLLVGRLYENPQDPVDRHLSLAEKIIKKYRVRSWQG